jgi:predicted anti-sigma-YlaC factor YlaD
MTCSMAVSSAARSVGRLLLRAVRVALLLLLVVIPVPVTFSWMKRLVGDRRNLPAETLRKD